MDPKSPFAVLHGVKAKLAKDEEEAKPAGELTSVATIPLSTGPIQLALGYVRREALDKKLSLEYPGGTATPIALPYSLPNKATG